MTTRHAIAVVPLALAMVATSLPAAGDPPSPRPSHTRPVPVASTAAEEPGTVGIGFAQLFADGQENKRGDLVVLQVVDGLPGAKAGIKPGDIVVAINGVSVEGRSLADIMREEIRGPVGSTVRLTVSPIGKPDTEIALVRGSSPPHTSQPTDPFAYLIPGNWRTDPRYPFPLPWAPSLAYKGVEDLFFAPDFGDTTSPEYHSYGFFWWLEGNANLTPDRLAADMTTYFQGLAQERAKSGHFTPDPSKVTATYAPDPSGPTTFGGAPTKSFRGRVSIYDSRGQVITLNSEVVSTFCSAANHTAAFFGMSLEPPDGDVWKPLHAIRDSFRCSR